jgi:hypothetical protein
MSRYFAAFDAAIAAAGYNAYHELIALGVPSLYVPMRRETDDQPARARHAEAAGLGLGVDGPGDAELDAKLDRLLEPDTRGAIASALAELPPPRGAAQAAEWLASLAGAPLTRDPSRVGRVSTPTASQSAQRAQMPPRSARTPPNSARTPPKSDPARTRRSFRRRWGTFLASAPRTAARLARQQLTEPRARTVIVALGIADEETPAAVAEALADSGEEPARTLVITDSLPALRALRELGVGIEHVPGRDSRQAKLSGAPYEEFVRGRLELIRAERPRPRRMLVAPGGAPLP